MVEENWGVDECQLSLFLSPNLSVIESNLLSHLFFVLIWLKSNEICSHRLSPQMGLMTNFKFWLIVGNPNPAQWCFLSWAWPANIYRLFRIGFFSPVSCNKNRRGESVLRLRGNSALGNYWCFLLARKSKSELLLLLYWHTLSFHFVCCSSLFFWILKFRFFNFKLTFFYFIHSYRWIWFVRVRENI